MYRNEITAVLSKIGGVMKSFVTCILAPHQPRLDWQMWFAALGSYHHNPWFVHLVYKLLHGEKVVLDLLDENQPFKKPPQFIRALLYKYHYTKVQQNISSISDFVHNTK